MVNSPNIHQSYLYDYSCQDRNIDAEINITTRGKKQGAQEQIYNMQIRNFDIRLTGGKPVKRDSSMSEAVKFGHAQENAVIVLPLIKNKKNMPLLKKVEYKK